MKKSIIAIASSDWHLYKFSRFDNNNSRLHWGIKAGDYIFEIARKNGVPLLNCGDLYHTPKEVDNETNSQIQKLLTRNEDVPWVGISGNHDLSEKNTLKNISPSHLDSLVGNIHLIGQGINYRKIPGVIIHGIDYMNDERELIETIKSIEPKKDTKNILMLHTDYFGATLPNGYSLGEVQHFNEKSYKMFKKFDLVLFGHIHKPQRLFRNGIMLGSPIHQIASDAGVKMGFWYIYNDMSFEFEHLDKFPQFIKLKPGETPKDDFNYYLEPEEEEAEIQNDEEKFYLSDSRKNLAKKYLRVKGIKSKKKRTFLINLLNSVE